jgi:hypothetical protein
MLTIAVPGRLLIPLGRPKWDIAKIRVTGVSTKGTYFESESPICTPICKRWRELLFSGRSMFGEFSNSLRE